MTKTTLITQVRAGEAILIVLILALASFPFLQSHASHGDQGDLQTRLEALKDIESSLQTISLNLLGYLEDHDGEHLERIKAGGKDVSHLLVVYKEGASDASHKDPKHVEGHYEELREATVSILKSDATQLQTRSALEQTSQALLQIFSDQIVPSIQPNQLHAYNRLRAALDAEVQARALARQAADSGRFRRAIETYQSLSDTRRARGWAQSAEQLFAQGQMQNQDLTTSLRQKKEALDRFANAYRDLSEALVAAARIDSPRGAGWMGGVPEGMVGGLLGMLILALVGIFFVDRMVVHRTMRPMMQLVAAAEAASSGDFSRTPDYLEGDQVGRLSAAVHRMITVLGRSENLVYHLAALVESSGDAIISQSLDGTILSWNKGAQRLYGYSIDEVKGRSIVILAPNEGGTLLMGALERIKHSDRPTPFEMIHRAKNGRSFPVLVRIAPILDSTRQVIGASFCAEEIPAGPAARPEISQPQSTYSA